MSRPLSQRAATLIGFSAVLLWSLLAFFTAASGTMPPLQLTAVTFGIGGLAGTALWTVRPHAIGALRQPWQVWLLGVGGLFGYHFFYFTSLRNAPPVEAGLINYFWPLLIVLFSALLPGERLRLHHIGGALLALAGAALIVTGGEGFSFKAEYALGYGAALVGALTWATYSVLSRRFAAVPSDAITGFCLITALLSGICHLLLEQTVWPDNLWQWTAIAALGLGPVGLAFYVWDIGVKKGDIQVLGAASYAAPLLSTSILIVTGYATYSHAVLVACLLITAGAVLAARDLLFGRDLDPTPTPPIWWDNRE
ncbi:MAG: EamA family transporter [Devosia sp.]|nr:EamA family transporter [Devosia sp.]